MIFNGENNKLLFLRVIVICVKGIFSVVKVSQDYITIGRCFRKINNTCEDSYKKTALIWGNLLAMYLLKTSRAPISQEINWHIVGYKDYFLVVFLLIFGGR